jgi:prepilin-type N-terminal cleavage/methylation domain-containing protein
MRLRVRKRAQSKTRDGFTLVEVIAALVIILGVSLGMAVFMLQFVRTVATASSRTTANELVADRLEDVKSATKYSTIDAVYAGTENAIPNNPGYVRQTIVSHVGGAPPDLYDYRIITVIVSGPGLRNPVKKSTVISAF